MNVRNEQGTENAQEPDVIVIGGHHYRPGTVGYLLAQEIMRLDATVKRVEALVTEAEDAEAASLSRTFDGGSFGAWVDAHALRRVLSIPPENTNAGGPA